MIAGRAKPTSCFLHIPKSGGSALTRHLQAVLGEAEVFHVEPPQYLSPSLLLGRFSVVAGHLHMGQIPEAFFRTIFFFTFLREPVDRVISLYYFLRHGDVDHESAPLKLGDDLDLDGVLTRYALPGGACTTMSNWQTLLFSGTDDINRPATELLPAALRNLERFDFVGIYEQLAAGAECLGRLRGWPPGGPLPRFKTSRRRPAVEQVDPVLRRRILEANRCDEVLYRRACELWAQVRTSAPAADGPTEDCRFSIPEPKRCEHGTREISFSRIKVVDGDTGQDVVIKEGNPVRIEMDIYSRIDARSISVGISVADRSGINAYQTNSMMLERPLSLASGESLSLSYTFNQRLFAGGYYLTAYILDSEDGMKSLYHWIDNVTTFWCVAKESPSFFGLVDLRAELTVHDPPPV